MSRMVTCKRSGLIYDNRYLQILQSSWTESDVFEGYVLIVIA
jgi:hypothetical protein